VRTKKQAFWATASRITSVVQKLRGDPQLTWREGLDELNKQTTLLGVAVFAGNHVHDQTALGIEDHQRLAGQRSAPQPPCFFNAVFRPLPP
jgi:hypothetical protein